MNISFQFSWGRFFILCLLTVLPLRLFAGVEFWKIFPNTVDDANLEYVEFRNTGCEEVDISGYVFSDANEKKYIFPLGTKVPSHESIQLLRTISKIILNNEDEKLFLTKSNGTPVDSFEYKISTKGVVIVDVGAVDEICPPSEPPVQTGTTEHPPTQTDSNSGTGVVEPPVDSGTTLPPTGGTGGSISGEIPPIVDTGSSASGGVLPPSGSGSTQPPEEIPPTQTGGSNPAPEEEIYFPEMTPHIQSPTNATMSGETFICLPGLPCRINVSFEEIFTGNFLMRDYVCEIITGSGTLTTCNPNTLYFTENASFGFRLTSKKNPSKMKSQYWDVVFTTLSPPIETGSTEMGEVIFPEIIPTFQNYTNTTMSGSEFLCTTTPCRLNFTLEPIFTGGLKMSDFSCQIIFGTGVYDSCNPPQLYPFSGAILTIALSHKASGQSVEKTFSFRFVGGVGTSPPGETPLPTIDTNPPIARIKFDGKIRDYHEFSGENELTCYTFTCSVNLSAEDSYDAEGSKISYLWYYGFNDVKTSRNPGERKYGLGEYQIWLRVIDEAGNVGEIRYKIHVVGPREEDEKAKKETKPKKIPGEKEKTPKKKSKKKKKLKMIFFEPPQIVLQSKEVTFLDENTYTCTTKTKKCSLNLSLTGAQKGISYIWTFPDGERVTSRNPKSHPFGIGVHEIHIAAFTSTGSLPLWEKDMTFTVIKEKKKPKKSKKKKHKTTQKKKVQQNTIPLATPSQEKENLGFSLISLLFTALLLGVLRFQKGRFLSKFRDQ